MSRSHDSTGQARQGDDDGLHLDGCEVAIGYRFQDRRLLRAALTHASGSDHRLGSNERLEFLATRFSAPLFAKRSIIVSRSTWRAT